MSDWPRTVPRLIRDSAVRYGTREAISDGDVHLTYADLADEAVAIARGLVARGVEPGDRVAVWAPNSHYWMRFSHGVHTAGATVVPINTRYRAAEAHELIQRTAAKVVLIHSGFLDYDYLGALLDVADDDLVGQQALAGLGTVVNLGEASPRGEGSGPDVIGWDELVAGGEAVDPQAVRAVADAVRPEDISEILFTSGTTGRAKGVTIAHGAGIDLYRDYGEIWGLREGDRYLLSLPMFHAGGNKAGILTCLIHGLTGVPMAVFDPVEMMRLIERERITVLNGPPTVIYSLLDHPDRGTFDLSSLRRAATGAAVVPVAMVERAHEELPFEHFITAYGMTECCGTATMCRAEDSHETIANTNGRALPGIELRIVDLEGKDLPTGEPGEVLIKGPNVTPGYWDTPQQTAEAIRDGWLHSGDIGTLDENGNLKITDRLKDMFFVGGFNVSPAEIEQSLARHPAVGEVSVIGVPDARLGEVARAYVIAKAGVEISEAEIVAWCRERMANFKVPRSVIFVDSLPRNAGGKVLKVQLRAETLEADPAATAR